MLYTIIKKNTYQDSVNLMLLSKKMSGLEGIKNVSIMMGTKANKEIFFNSGLYTEKLEEACPNDLCIVIDTEEEKMVDKVLEEMKSFFESANVKSKKKGVEIIHSFSTIENKMPDANIALISIPGEYAFKESMKALERNMNVFLFSDNVSLEQEFKLKSYAESKNLIVMGPDCGTSILRSVPFAFANEVKKGKIGVVGASGTGIQEIITHISNLGSGITHAIGLGGRDLKEEIGAISALRAIDMLENDKETEIIVFVSKPPAKKIMEKVLERFEKSRKPIIANFLGAKDIKSDKVIFTKTLAKTAKKAVLIADYANKINKKIEKVLGLYCGGTLAQEAAILIDEKLNDNQSEDHKNGVMFENSNIKIIDLGDDFYTKGKPHPMIDPSIRIDVLEKEIENYDLILLDNVIGYGANLKMAEYTRDFARKHKDKLFVCSITGTEQDLQKYSKEKEFLNEENIILFDTNEESSNAVLDIIKISNIEKNNDFKEEKNLLNEELKVVNMGLRKFLDPFVNKKIKTLQFDFKPIAGGNKELEKILEDLK